MSNEIKILDDDFIKIVKTIEQDILETRFNIIAKANKEVIDFYLRLGKIISDNAKYGNNFINKLSVALKLDFPGETGFSPRNLARMRKVYESYKDLTELPKELEMISWSQNCVLVDKIEDFDKRVWYAKQVLEKYIDEWIEKVKKQYYLKVPILVENLSDDILNEIVFNFLDNLTMNIKTLEDKNKPYTYYKNEEKINNIINIINGLELFYEEIIKTKDSPNKSDAVAFLTPTYNLTGKFLLFNPLIQFNGDEIKLLDMYLHKTNPNVSLKFLDNGTDKKIQLSFLAIQELQKRRKDTVKRIWNKKNIVKCKEDFPKEVKCIRSGYSKEDLVINTKYFLDIIAKNYNFVFNKHGYPNNYYLNDLHLINLDENNIQKYSDYIKRNDIFEVKRISNDIKTDKKNIISTIESNLEFLFLLDTPLYETVRILLYIGIMKSNGYKIKNESINYNVKFEELPIINYYIT